MLELPNSPIDPILLSDWLELQALISPDGNASRGDLESALRVAGLFELDDDERLEQQTIEVFGELEQRSKAAREAYPFTVNYGVLQTHSNWEGIPAYIFCLCLSYFGWIPNPTNSINPRKLFEQISCAAAKGYLQGDVVGFGAPRTELPPSFPEAVSELCKRLEEGDGYSGEPLLNRQDDRVDLVAWKNFPDKLPGKIVMFGQCASGKHWRDKLAEMWPESFWGQWMARSHVSPLVRSFFVPYRIERAWWRYASGYAGVVFDRCRIAYWATVAGQQFDYSPYLEWTKGLLASISEPQR
jgi:hypothetical protein